MLCYRKTSSPAGTRVLFYPKTSSPALGCTRSLSERFPAAVFMGVKWSGPEAEHSCVCIAEVSKGVAVPQLFHIHYRHDGRTTSRYHLLVLLTSFLNHFLTIVTDS